MPMRALPSYDGKWRSRRLDGRKRGTWRSQANRLGVTNMSEKDPNAKDRNSEDREPPSKPENSAETEKLDDRAKKVSDDDDLPA